MDWMSSPPELSCHWFRKIRAATSFLSHEHNRFEWLAALSNNLV